MDEQTNVNEVVEESPVAEEPVEEATSSFFDAALENDDDDFYIDETFDETDQSADEPQPEETEPTAEEEVTPEDADQWLELKHFDTVQKVNKEQAKVLAQKGLDYDRIRGKLDNLQKYEDFLKEIQGDFASIDDLMDDTRARLAADKDGISYEEALGKVKSGKNKAQTQEEILETMRQNSVQAFAEAHPEIKPEDIPEEVWNDIFNTNNLEASYVKWEAKKLAEENKILKQNAKNKSRSAGSMKSSGNASYEKSEFDRVFEEDDW